ncbi:MAG: family 10 glycosylhydrolase [Spirulina sp. SIO3F2]|nr:family 10 glycosylhydrolase [Spirulina sp. SIO3F2]
MEPIATTVTVNEQGVLTAQLTGVEPGDYTASITLTTPEAPTSPPTPAPTPPPQFKDTAGHWAEPFIRGLAQTGLIRGFPDNTFRPDKPFNRAQFASLLAAAFQLPVVREAITFRDVYPKYWAAESIAKAYQMGILSGYPNRAFRPNLAVTKIQVIVALVNAVKPTVDSSAVLLPKYYTDWMSVPDYGQAAVKSATQVGMVINHPDPKLLGADNEITRAEVAALFYQALAYSGRVQKINSEYIVQATTQPGEISVTVQHQREFRGAWVASVWNLNFPSKKGLPTAQQQQEIRTILDRLQDLGFNALIFQVRPEGDALYSSQLEPWSAWLTGKQGQAPNPFYDPLDYVVDEAHKRAIEVHAWFNPYRARTPSQTSPTVAPHIDATDAKAVYVYGKQRWMDPGLKSVQDRTYDVILDVAQRYDIDGIHLDDYFYPYPIPGVDFPDKVTYDRYRNGGGKLSRSDWRRANVNTMIERLAKGIRTAKPHIKFGISPFGIYRPGQPAGIKGLDQYAQLYADPKHWLAQGWVDYIAPQLYWPIAQTQQSYTTLLKWWTQNNPKQAHIYVGNNLVKVGTMGWPTSEFEQQVKLSRQMAKQESLGNIFYNVKPLLANTANVNATFKKLYAQPALAPVMADKASSPPAQPVNLEIRDRTVSWQSPNPVELRSWTLYRGEGNGWRLERVLPLQTQSVTLTPGYYALCAVNRLAQESQGVVFEVQ